MKAARTSCRPSAAADAAPPPPSMDNANQRAAADFYNSLKRTRQQGERGQTRIYHLRRLNNWVKAEIIQQACRGKEAPSILDLACGKGGDLGKFIRAAPGRYVGVDIAKTSLEDAVERLESDSRRWGAVPVTLVECSLGGSSILEASPRQVYADQAWSTAPYAIPPSYLMWRRCSSFTLHGRKRPGTAVMFLAPSNQAGR